MLISVFSYTVLSILQFEEKLTKKTYHMVVKVGIMGLRYSIACTDGHRLTSSRIHITRNVILQICDSRTSISKET